MRVSLFRLRPESELTYGGPSSQERRVTSIAGAWAPPTSSSDSAVASAPRAAGVRVWQVTSRRPEGQPGGDRGL